MGNSSDDDSDDDTSSDDSLIIESNSDSRNINESGHDDGSNNGNNDDNNNNDDDVDNNSGQSNNDTSKGNQPPKKRLKFAKDEDQVQDQLIQDEDQVQDQLIQRVDVTSQDLHKVDFNNISYEQFEQFKNSFDVKYIDIFNEIMVLKNDINDKINECILIEIDIILNEAKIIHLKKLLQLFKEKLKLFDDDDDELVV